MSETPSQPATTPARRRQGRGNGRTGAHKAYASENDVANFDPARYDRHPRTPQKTANIDSVPQTNMNSKQRSKNKPRSKVASPSPESAAQKGRQTPPHQSSSIKTASVPAFAGATFHASPAPSALPLPSFFSSKSNTESPSARASRDAALQHSPPVTDNEASTPSGPAPPPTSESPLDFMFRAHRQEKERHRSGSFASYQPPALASGSPSFRSPFEASSVAKPATLPQAARPHPYSSTACIDDAELGGTPGRPIGPAFSTPYQERIRAARANVVRSPDTQSVQTQGPTAAHDDPTEALKKYLFAGLGSPSSGSAPASFSSPKPVSSQDPPAYGHKSPNAGFSPEGRSNDIQAMEDNLRRVLKLDLGSNSHTERRLFS